MLVRTGSRRGYGRNRSAASWRNTESTSAVMSGRPSGSQVGVEPRGLGGCSYRVERWAAAAAARPRAASAAATWRGLEAHYAVHHLRTYGLQALGSSWILASCRSAPSAPARPSLCRACRLDQQVHQHRFAGGAVMVCLMANTTHGVPRPPRVQHLHETGSKLEGAVQQHVRLCAAAPGMDFAAWQERRSGHSLARAGAKQLRRVGSSIASLSRTRLTPFTHR